MELTFLEKDEIIGKDKLKLFNKVISSAKATDFALVTGCYCSDYGFSPYWTKTISEYEDNIYTINFADAREYHMSENSIGIRPIIKYKDGEIDFSKYNISKYFEADVLEYGYYPQWAPGKEIQDELEKNYSKTVPHGLHITDITYTINSGKYDNGMTNFKERKIDVYKYKDKFYTRLLVKPSVYNSYKCKLSNDMEYKPGDYVWIEISPARWFIDRKDNILLADMILLSGICYSDVNPEYKKPLIFDYMNNYMFYDLFKIANTKVNNEDKKEYEDINNKLKYIRNRVKKLKRE